MDKIKVSTFKRLIERAGAERVSKEGAIALGKALDEIGVKIAKAAVDYAHHAKRKTVKAKDIEIALEKFLGRTGETGLSGMVRKVYELKQWLSQFPDDWDVWAYEGEVVGIVVADPDDHCNSYVFHNRRGEDKWVKDEQITP